MTTTAERPADPDDYPRGGTFGNLLHWHLDVWGTRRKSGTAMNTPWTPKHITIQVIFAGQAANNDAIKDAHNNIKHWKLDGKLPRDTTKEDKGRVERLFWELFGDNEDLRFWKQDLEEALKAGREEKARAAKLRPKVRAAKAKEALIQTGLRQAEVQLKFAKAADQIIAPTTESDEWELRPELSYSMHVIQLTRVASDEGYYELAATAGLSVDTVNVVIAHMARFHFLQNERPGRWLKAWLDSDRLRFRERPTVGPEFDAAWDHADLRFRRGHSRPSEALMLVFHSEKLEQNHRLQALQCAIEFERFIFNIDGAFEKERQRVEFIKKYNSPSSEGILLTVLSRARVYCDGRPDKVGYDGKLLGLRIYELALEERPRFSCPLEWAAIQKEIGDQLAAFNGAFFEEAIIAYRLALEERTQALAPLDRAETQNSLGLILSNPGFSSLEFREAISIHLMALEAFTRDEHPLKWALTQSYLGRAFYVMACEKDGEIADIVQSVQAYRSALEILDQDQQLGDWCRAQFELGLALVYCGIRQNHLFYIREAAKLFQNMLSDNNYVINFGRSETEKQLTRALKYIVYFEKHPERVILALF